MDAVPAAPMSRTSGRYMEIYQKISTLGLGERNALRVSCETRKTFVAIRTALRKIAEREGKMLCTSRTLDYKFGYFWLVKPEK